MAAASGFTIFSQNPVIGDSPKRITCMDTWGSRVVIGFSDGSLRIMEGDSQKVNWRQSGEERKAFAKTITQLQVVKHDERFFLLSLCDGVVRVSDLPGLATKETLSKSNGCNLFAINKGYYSQYGEVVEADHEAAFADGKRRPDAKASPASSPLLLCVRIPKRLQFYRWEEKKGFHLQTEVAIDDKPILAMEWIGDHMLVAFQKSWGLVSPNSQDIKYLDMAPALGGHSPAPAIARLPEDKEVFIPSRNPQNKLVLGTFINLEGRPTRGATLQLPEAPAALCYFHPYILIAYNNHLEVRSTKHGGVLQTLPIRGITMMTRKGYLLMGTDKTVRYLAPLPLPTVVVGMVKRAAFEDAQDLVNLSRDEQWIHKADYTSESQFVMGDEDDGLDRAASCIPASPTAAAAAASFWETPHTQQEKLNELTIRYAYYLFNRGDWEKSMFQFTSSKTDPRKVLSLFPDVLPHKAVSVHAPVRVRRLNTEEEKNRATHALVTLLTQYHHRFLHRRDAPELEGKDEDGEHEGGETLSLPALVDTAILKAYLICRSAVLKDFLSQENFCDIEEAKRVLSRMPIELVTLYKTRGLHEEALDLLKTIADKSTLRPDLERIVMYLKDLAKDRDSENGPPPSPKRQIVIDLVFKYTEYVITTDAELGLSIFTFTHIEGKGAVGGIPPLDALQYLRKHQKELCIPYLESLIKSGETTQLFHNKLLEAFAQEAQRLLNRKAEHQAMGIKPGEALDDEDSVPRPGPPGSSSPSKLSRPPAAARGAPPPASPPIEAGRAGSEPGELGTLRKKILQFLRQTPTYYSAEAMLGTWPPELLEERAILLSRLKRHQQALTIYAHKLKSPQMAEDYCAQHYDPMGEEEKTIYLKLLEVYLQPSDPEVKSAPLLSAAFSLLTKYFDRIEPEQALRLLPNDTPIAELEPFLSALLSRTHHKRRQNQVIKYLLRSENISIRFENLKAGRPRIVIDESSVCQKCMKKIGTSAFARHPNGQIMHYSCTKL